MKKKNKGFTLIELISVLVILAILALIVTPLVLNIIRKARVSADKRSIDAYGRSIELAVASYLLDNGSFPTSIEQLTIEYSGDRVECETTKLNSDSSVYLANCTVAGREVTGYTYGEEEAPTYTAYTVGNQVSYNNVDYYVIKDSDASESTVTLLKAEPLTVEQVNTYGGVGTENNHVNMYVTDDPSASEYQKAYNSNGYGGMAYYSSSTCGYNTSDRCTTDYTQSDIKYIVDAWKASEAPQATEARLIKYDEVVSLGYNENCIEDGYCEIQPSDPEWLYGTNYWYWTMITYEAENNFVSVWAFFNNGFFMPIGVNYYDGVVRPVITLSKSVL